jgi:MYXO-CTERM domain-containing protein
VGTRRALVVSWVVSAAASVWLPQPAAACSMAPPPQFEIDPGLQGVDTTPPTAFGALQASTRQISATHCEGSSCTSNSCGDSGRIELTFDAPVDDHTNTAELGYRVVWLRGRMPNAMRNFIDRVQVLRADSQLNLELGFSGVTELDGEFALVAVDRAGNESAPSEPIRVQWNGCTSFWDSPNTCESDFLDCSVGAGPGQRHARSVALPLAAAGLALLLRRRKRASSRSPH